MPVGYYKDEAKTAKTFKVIDGNDLSLPEAQELVHAQEKALARISEAVKMRLQQ